MILIFTYIMAGLTLVGSAFNAKKLRIGFLLWSISNFWWICRNVMIGEYAQSAVYMFNMCISIYGFISWGKQRQLDKADVPSEKIQTENDPYQTRWDNDLFYLREGQGSVKWIYYNPDSDAGGQYVENVIYYDDILKAAQHEAPFEFFDCLGSDCKQWLIDIGTDGFAEYDRDFKEEPYSFKSADADTRARLIVFAKKYKEEHGG